MTVYLTNTSSGKKEVFKPIKKGHVGLYLCGPTVYWTAHIGNFRTISWGDFVVRAFKYLNYKTKYVMNITDVGHLVGDGDEGEDKVLKTAKKLGISPEKVAEKYTKEFLKHMRMLNLLKPNYMPKASEHIKEQIKIIEKLEQKGFTYKISDGIYFDTSKYKEYGKIFNIDLKNLLAGARVELNPEKKNPTDFALWKFSDPKKGSRLQEWDSPWGRGFPGWHIECSAMSTKYLGQPFDIHMGGEDHIFPHHPNEEAQSRCAFDKPLANYWLHVRFMTVSSTKMSKSKGNFLTLNDIVNRGFEPLALRYYYMTSHYTTPVNFTWSALESSQVGLNNLRKTLKRWSESKGGIGEVPEELDEQFKKALADDFNYPQALAFVWGLTKNPNYKIPEKRAALLKWDTVLGLKLSEYLKQKSSSEDLFIPKDVRLLVTKREKYRKEKKFDKADEMREKLEELGYVVEDTPSGPIVTPVGDI